MFLFKGSLGAPQLQTQFGRFATSASLIGSFLLLASCGNAKRTSASVADTTIDGSAPTTLGKGINTLTQKIKGQCVDLGGLVDGAGNSQDSGNTSQSQKAEINILDITSITSLSKQLNVDGAASFNTGVNKGSAKVSFAQSVNMNSESKYLMVHVKVKNTVQVEKNPVFTKGVQDAIQNGKYVGDDFLTNCGNEYVYSVTKGGEYIAILEFESSTKEESEKLSASIKASIGIYKGSVSVESALQRFSKNTLRQVRQYRSGSSGAFPDIANMEEFGKIFPSLVENTASGQPDILEYKTREYVGVGPQGLTPNVVGLETQKLIIENLASERDRALYAKNTVSFIQSEAAKYETPVESLELAGEKLSTHINQVNFAAMDCFSDYKKCALPVLSFPKVQLPERKKAPEVGDEGWKRIQLPKLENWSIDFPTRGAPISTFGFTDENFKVQHVSPRIQFSANNGVFSPDNGNVSFELSYSEADCSKIVEKGSLSPNDIFIENNSNLTVSLKEIFRPGPIPHQFFVFSAMNSEKNKCIEFEFFPSAVADSESYSIFDENVVSKRLLKIAKSIRFNN
jgi:hypothetical protein